MGGWGWIWKCARASGGSGERGQNRGLSVGDEGAADNVESVIELDKCQ